MNQKKTNMRRLGKKSDILLILILIFAAIVGLFWFYPKISENDGKKTENPIAQISYRGTLVKSIALYSAQDEIFTLPENENVNFQIKDHKIKFHEVNCPDKICERVGYISTANQVAICLPNQVSLKIVSSNSETDAVVL